MRGEEEEGGKWRRRRRETSEQARPLDNDRAALLPPPAAIPRGEHIFLGKEAENFLRNGLKEKKKKGGLDGDYFFGHAAPQGRKLESVLPSRMSAGPIRYGRSELAPFLQMSEWRKKGAYK